MCENYEVMKLQTWIDMFDPDEINLDKLEEYLEFIKEAVKRYDPERYSEFHHILPRCLDKEYTYDSNLAQINGRDHFLAHMKLIECFNGIKKSRLSYALIKMKEHISSKGENITPEEWEDARRLFIESIKGSGNPMYGKTGESSPMYGVHRYGKDNPMYGKHHSEETRKKLSERLSGENHPMYGKLSYWHGRTLSEETKQKMSEAQRGSKNHNYGKHWITNGVKNKTIPKDDPVPEGWRYGKTTTKKLSYNIERSNGGETCC